MCVAVAVGAAGWCYGRYKPLLFVAAVSFSSALQVMSDFLLLLLVIVMMFKIAFTFLLLLFKMIMLMMMVLLLAIVLMHK